MTPARQILIFRSFLILLLAVIFFLSIRNISFADTTQYKSAEIVTTDNIFGSTNVNFTDLEDCSATDGFTCNRVSATGYGNLYFRNFGDFGIPDGATITHIRIRVTGKSNLPYLALFTGLSRLGSLGNIFFETCQGSNNWTMYALNSSTIQIYNVTTPLTNGNLSYCLTPSNINTGNYIFRIHFSAPYPWSASIDNFEIAFDYTPPAGPTPTPTPVGPQPFLDLPWDYQSQGKSFEDAAFDPGSWFDHEYPLQNFCCDPPVMIFTGKIKNENYHSHNGYDYSAKNGIFLGTFVLAAADGWVTFKPEALSGGAGNVIKIDHGNGYQTWYEHLSNSGLIVSSEQEKVYVNKGQKIGEVGMTGNTNGPHIHFSVFKDSNNNGIFEDDIPWGTVDPLGWEGDFTDPWEEWESGGRNGSKSYKLFSAQAPPKEEEIAQSGGSLSLGNILVNFLQNTFTTNAKIVAALGPFESFGLFNSVSSSIFLNAYNDAGQKITQFLEPVTINYNYSDADLLNINEESLKVYWFNEETGEWEGLPSLVDTINKTVSAQTSHFSQFALMGELKDLVAPATNVILSGEKGEKDWFRSDVNVQLFGEDNNGGVGLLYTLYSLNGSDWFEYSEPIEFLEEGEQKITYESYDKAENKEERKIMSFSIDKTPPVISYQTTQDGNPYTLETWINKDVLVTFSCTDSFSGASFISDSVLVSSEGENQSATGECRDRAGNTSFVTVSGINIDKTPPLISLSTDPTTLWAPNGKLVPVTIYGEISELHLGTQTFKIIDEYGGVMPSISNFGDTVYLDARRNGYDYDGRSYSIELNATDLAGNKSTAQTVVLVPHDQSKK